MLKTVWFCWIQSLLYHSSDEYIKGFEVPLLVLFTTNLEGSHNERVISRCMSELVVVCGTDSVERFFARGQYSNHYSMKIDISGKSLIHSNSKTFKIIKSSMDLIFLWFLATFLWNKARWKTKLLRPLQHFKNLEFMNWLIHY